MSAVITLSQFRALQTLRRLVPNNPRLEQSVRRKVLAGDVHAVHELRRERAKPEGGTAA